MMAVGFYQIAFIITIFSLHHKTGNGKEISQRTGYVHKYNVSKFNLLT